MSASQAPAATLPDAAEAERPLDAFRDDPGYLGADHARNERRTRIVAVICAAALVLQLAGGAVFNSMALMASAIHMAAHVVVLAVAAGAYALARRHARDPRFAFGAGKIGYLAGFANGVALAMTALFLAGESLERLLAPETVDFMGALPLALAGLALTLVCIAILRPGAARDDLNIDAAHLHLSADAAVSVLSLAGLAAGAALGWTWADPAAGLIGAGLVAQFAVSILRRSGAVLLDLTPDPALADEIARRLAEPGLRLIDLHLWRLGPGRQAAILVIEAPEPLPAHAYRARLAGISGLAHLTVEVRPAR